MADIHVETKKHNSTPVWVWILVALAILGLVAYFLTRDNDIDDEKVGVENNTTSYIQQPEKAVHFI